jgi:hypothetical protein
MRHAGRARRDSTSASPRIPTPRAPCAAWARTTNIRTHMMSAVLHLLQANPCPEVLSFADHAENIIAKLTQLLQQHRAEIEANLAHHRRPWSDVLHYLRENMCDWARWCLDHPGVLRRKSVRLHKGEKKQGAESNAHEICAYVARVIGRLQDDNPFTEYAQEVLERGAAELLVAPTGSRKSTLMREAAVRYVMHYPDRSVAFLMPRHKLGEEQIEMLRREHPLAKFSAAVWRGRHADDPENALFKMCKRAGMATLVEDAKQNVEHSLFKQGRGKKEIKCIHYDDCAYQRQKKIEANIWFAAHECLVHEIPKAFGDIGLLLIDESPLDAFLFGIDRDDRVELSLDLLCDPVADDQLKTGRRALHRVLDKLRVPIDRHLGVPVPLKELQRFLHHVDENGLITLAAHDATALVGREWEMKVDREVRPNMSDRQIEQSLAGAAALNTMVETRARLWKLITQSRDIEGENYGRIQVQRGKGRVIRLVGLHAIANGWNVRTMISDATGDAELLRAIWPHLDEEQPLGWQQLPRPWNVRLLQLVDRSISKWAVAIEGDSAQALERKEDAARRMYAGLLISALKYKGQPVAAIVYKSTREWIEQNCFVPSWLTLVHHGDVAGTNAFSHVRALYVVGRPLPQAETITRTAEAIFGVHIRHRDYVKSTAQIPIEPDDAGNTAIEVETWVHPDPTAERLRRLACEGALIQAVGRARAGLRSSREPLDIHLWTDVAVPELGAVEPVLWHEIEAKAGLDGLMLATSGVWLESARDAAKAYSGLFTRRGLQDARSRSEHVSLIGIPIRKTCSLPLKRIRYQRAGRRLRPTHALVLPGADARAWLEPKLGPLARFEEVDSASRGMESPATRRGRR